MRRVVVCLGLVGLLAVPAFAQKTAAPAAAPADDEEDDDILAPVRTGDRPATAVPVKERAFKVGVMPIVPLGDVGKTVAEQLGVELSKSLNESGTVEFVALRSRSADGAAPVDPAIADAAKKDAEQLLDRSQQLLAKLQFGKAKSSFEKTLAAIDKAAPALDTPQLAMEAWLGLAEIAARQAQDDETSRCLAVVVGFNPEYDLDTKRFPGLFVTQHRKARDRLLQGDKSSITVDASAAGAQVFIDGRPVAVAPAKAKGLYPGNHIVRVVREGQAPWGALVVVEPGADVTVRPGFFDPKRKGPSDDLGQNRFSVGSAATVAEAAAAQNLAGAVVGVLAKMNNRVVVQLVYVDAKGRGVGLTPQMKLQGDLLDIGIEVLKARSRVEELATKADAAFAEADGSEPLIEGANAGAAVTMSEVAMRFDVKMTGNLPVVSRDVRGGDDEDGDGGRKIVESKTGSRRSIDDGSDRLSGKKARTVDMADEDGAITDQPWFLPTAIAAGVVGVAALATGAGVALVAFKVIPDPRPANGAQIVVTLPTATAAQ